MRTTVNMTLQMSVVAACALLRLLTPGWLLALFLPVWGIVLIMQLVLACRAMPRGRLTTGVSLAFGSMAASLLGACLLMTDGGDTPRSVNSPLGLLLGHDVDALVPVAMLLMLVWVGALIWTIAGLAATRPQPVVVPYGWPHPAPPARRM